MRKRVLLLKSLLVCLLALAGVRVQAQVDIYGFAMNVNDDKVSGIAKFNSSDPANTMERISVIEEWATAGAYGGDAYYAILTWATYPKGLYTIDLTTGQPTLVADYMYNESIRAAIEMSYDYTTGTMYMVTVSDADEYHTAFGTVDLKSGAQTIINADMGHYIVALAVDKDGNVYGISDGGLLMTINKSTGKCTTKHNLSIYPWRRQSMEFDRTTGDLYWAYSNSTQSSMLKKVNIKKGTLTDLGYVGGKNDEQVLGLYIPYKQSEDAAPHRVTDLQFTPGAEGALTATLTWNCPTTTFDGGALESITKVEIYRNGELAATLTEAQPGAAMSWTEELTAAGNYTYKVQPYNEAGAGLTENVTAYVGRDLPKAVNITRVEREGNTAVRLCWNPCTKGANGGYLDLASLTYTVTRTDDGAVLAEGLTDTTYTDNSITELSRYSYDVTAITSDGTGEAATTGYIVTGPARDLPFETDFTNADESKLWSVADRDGDGTAFFWQYNPNFLDQGFYYYQSSYDEGRFADDWIVSPKYKFAADIHYKAVITARPANSYSPEMMELYLVSDYDLSRAVRVSDTIRVNGELDADGNMVFSTFRVNIPALDESGEYSVAVRCISNLEEAYWLGVARVAVSENEEGHIRGSVWDDSSNPVEGVTVRVDGTDFSAVTDLYGEFEIQNVPAGSYTLTSDLLGYESVPATVTVGERTTVNVELDVIKIACGSLGGTVKNAYGEPLPNATVRMSGYNSYETLTAADGTYRIEGVYLVAEPYTVEAAKDFYVTETYSLNYAEVNTTDFLKEFTLSDHILPPAAFFATPSADDRTLELQWTAAGLPYAPVNYSGRLSETFGSEEGDVNTLIGIVCHEPMLLDSLHWLIFSDFETVNVVILALDEQGNLTGEELYRDENAPNSSYNDSYYKLAHTVYAPHGCFIGLSADEGYLALITTVNTDEKPFLPRTNAYIEDLSVAAKLEYVEGLGSIYEENFLMDYSGQKLADSEAPAVTWKLNKADGSVWENATQTYSDAAWGSFDEGTYTYTVEAVYRNGEHSEPVTLTLEKTTPAGIAPVANDTRLRMEGSTLLVEADAVQIVSANGRLVWEGEGNATLSTRAWTNGIYLVRTLKNGEWKTEKVIISY